MRSIPDASGHARPILDWLSARAPSSLNTAEAVQSLQATMQDDVGPLRDAKKLTRALAHIDALGNELGDAPPEGASAFDMRMIDWLDLRNMLLVARSVAQAALARTESRGAQQREDFPQTSPEWAINQFVRLSDNRLRVTRADKPLEAVAS
jgi:succinate dehydrogenase/fumarate reductase flavoprotein subunit